MNELVVVYSQLAAHPASKIILDKVGDKALDGVLHLITRVYRRVRGLPSPPVGLEDSVDIQARVNTLNFVLKMLPEMNKALESGALTTARLRLSAGSVQVEMLLESALRGALQSSDPITQDALARLVVRRFSTEDDSTLSINLRLACDAVPNCTPRLLRILALTYYIQNYQFTFDETVPLAEREQTIATQLTSDVEIFLGIKPEWTDLKHLESVGLIKMTGSAERDYQLHSTNTLVSSVIQSIGQERGPRVAGIGYIFEVGQTGPSQGLNYVELNTVGSILAEHVLDMLRGHSTDLALSSDISPSD
jgi:hypothetical protein